MTLVDPSNPSPRRRTARPLFATALAAGIIGLSLLTGSAAHAQQPSKEELAKARTAFQEGVALAAANNCAAALVKYKEVATVKMTAQVSFNIAECEERLGKLVQALGNYRLAVSQAGEEKNLQKLLREAGSRVENIENRIPKLTITRGKGSEAAQIQLDGTEIGQSQLGVPMPVDPGAHVIIAKVEGKEYLHENVSLSEKETKTFAVKVDVPKPKIEKAPVDQGPTEPPPPPPKSRVPGIVVTAVGGAALITGLAAIGVRQGAISTLNGICKDNKCPDTQQAHDAASKGKTFTGLSEIMVPVGVAAAVVGIVLIANAGPQKAKTETDAGKAASKPKVDFVGWAPGASVGGASIVGSF
ncbi:Hypothetical protein A7982_03472 [Minicystis rosea]|nr:Hypothetical protein A7982_03472 [Minicystis rosea]